MSSLLPEASPRPRKTDPAVEYLACVNEPEVFIRRWVRIFDAHKRRWIPFELWPEQGRVIGSFNLDQYVAALKARQLGLTWGALAFSLWLRVFRPGSTVMLFSKREAESADMLFRLRGMYAKLPPFFQRAGSVVDGRCVEGNGGYWGQTDGGWVRSFPHVGGDSYQASLAIVDEVDLIPDLNDTLRSVKATVDGGGKLFLISRSDKSKPNSPFKNIYLGGKRGENGYAVHFLPWWVRPERTQEWYAEQCKEAMAREGSLDFVHEQYPATDAEALAARSLDKRIPKEWLDRAYQPQPSLTNRVADIYLSVPSCRVYELPQPGARYAVGADPAEGNPTSDDSAFVVTRVDTGAEVASYRGKCEPDRFALYATLVATVYNKAPVLFERNNHGHACLGWCRNNPDKVRVQVANGPDGRPGFLSSSSSKVTLYDAAAQTFRDRGAIIRSTDIYTQLQSIEAGTLRAPEGCMDDLADAYALSIFCGGQASANWFGGFSV